MTAHRLVFAVLMVRLWNDFDFAPFDHMKSLFSWLKCMKAMFTRTDGFLGAKVQPTGILVYSNPPIFLPTRPTIIFLSSRVLSTEPIHAVNLPTPYQNHVNDRLSQCFLIWHRLIACADSLFQNFGVGSHTDVVKLSVHCVIETSAIVSRRQSALATCRTRYASSKTWLLKEGSSWLIIVAYSFVAVMSDVSTGWRVQCVDQLGLV